MFTSTSRRQLLITAAALASGLSARIAGAALTETPSQSEGPFYPVEWSSAVDNDLIGLSSGRMRARGEALALSGRVLDTSGAPQQGVRVEIWQCDSGGIYRHPRDHRQDEFDSGFRGFGASVTDSTGAFTFQTIVPVPYPGRPPHIHAKLWRRGDEQLTTQLYLDGHPGNERDGLLSRLLNRNKDTLMIAPRASNLDGVRGFEASYDFVV